MTKWNCVNCGYTVADGSLVWGDCPDCGDCFLIIPKRMDNALFIATVKTVADFYNLATTLNNQEDAVELWDYDDQRAGTIRDWSDFRKFFGNYFYRQFQYIEEESE